jgi:uncharacterized paraquat-inducible protein A
MGRPKGSRKDAIIAEYQRQARTGTVNYCAITRNVGLKSNTGSYAKRIVQKWKEEKNPQVLHGHVRECLCCDEPFVSEGKHDRLCDRCETQGEYMAPYSLSPAIHQVGRAF